MRPVLGFGWIAAAVLCNACATPDPSPDASAPHPSAGTAAAAIGGSGMGGLGGGGRVSAPPAGTGGAAARPGGAGGAGGRQATAGASGSSVSAGSGAAIGTGPSLASCPAFPADDVWNRDVEAVATSAAWTAHLRTLVGAKNLHPDYGNSGTDHYGIPINKVPNSQPKVAIHFDDYPDESDPGPYPLPSADQAHIEGGTPTACDGDCHLIVVQEGACRLYEGYACHYASDGWHCANGASWDLSRKSEGQRPVGFTSADAAGLAIAPGMVRYDEAHAGEIRHAIRFTLHCTRANYVDPATHAAVPNGCSAQDPDAPPMGLRVRLKASYDISKLSGAAKTVARAMQRYGMILADNGSDFYFQGEEDTRWTAADVEPLKGIPSDAFEALEPGPLKH